MLNYKRYKRVPVVNFPERTWPDKEIEKAPVWCSVDLRDGNQSLVIPMSLEEKLEFYHLLLRLGFKEIEVGFPAASETEYEFLRTLIENNMIPKDVSVQVLTQCREHIIRKTFEACKGAPSAIIHFYNSVSVAQREQVFRKSKEEIKQIAVEGAKLVKKLASEYEGNFRFEYSPESFTGTEPEYALEVCNAVLDVLEPSESNNVIINLPVTVEMSMPHVYAGQVEYMSENLKYRGMYLEVQVRTLFEEGWGEIDHHILYPYKKQNPMLTEFSELLNRLAGMGDEMASFYRRLQDVPGDAFLDKKSMVDVRREYETHETQVGRIELEKIETVQDAIDSILAE